MQGAATSAGEFRGGLGYKIEGALQLRGEPLTFGCQNQSSAGFLYKFPPDCMLKVLNMTGHDGVRYRQVISCRSDTSRSGESLKSAGRNEVGQ
jgi:hypothetical protein